MLKKASTLYRKDFLHVERRPGEDELIMMALLVATTASITVRPTIPTISMQVDGAQTRMDTIAIMDKHGGLEVRTIGPSGTIPVQIVDLPGVETTTPSISYEHLYALKNARTGEIVAFDQIVVRREAQGALDRGPIADRSHKDEGKSR